MISTSEAIKLLFEGAYITEDCYKQPLALKPKLKYPVHKKNEKVGEQQE